MKTKIFLAIILLACVKSYGQKHQTFHSIEKQAILYDDYGRIIQNEEYEKIVYSRSETYQMKSQFSVNKSIQFKKSNALIPNNKNMNYCTPSWEYAIMGTYIGRRSLNSYDIDNDGIIEIICGARSTYNSGYWYILKYDSINQVYEQSWVSDTYESYIKRITVYDIDNNGSFEIIVVFEDGNVLFYDSNTKAVIAQIAVPFSGSTFNDNDIEFGDADNDGAIEIAISDADTIYFYDMNTFSLKSQIAYGANDFKIGNVDGDSQIEIVTTKGIVLSYNGVSVTQEWTFDSNITSDYNHLIDLSDIDSDGMEEIIRAQGWDYIDVYDANTQSLKFQIQTSHDIHALLLKDVNNDNVDEILYGDAQWGSIHCINSITQVEMWNVNNPDHGITDLALADVDNDNTLEVMWGAGWTSSGGDYLHVADIATQSIEWTSIAIDGPFYAIQIDDIDNDGVKEIVAISYESDSGYESGIISVFDSDTYELEWQSDGNYLNNVWTGVFDFEILDIDTDGIKEIIVAAGQTYTGKIWIIDGVTKAIESSYLFTAENIDEFYQLAIEDIDSDGDIEIIVLSDTEMNIINPSDYSVEWSSVGLAFSGWHALLTGNVDFDSATEIVVCKGYLYTIDGISQQQLQSTESTFTNIDLYDFDNDGIDEIVAGTSDGYIKIIDGATLQTSTSIKVSNDEIDGIKVADLNGDSVPEYVFTSNGSVYFFSDTSLYQYTQTLASIAGKYNGLKIIDVDNDGTKEIFVGSSNKVMELGSECYKCAWFDINEMITNKSCGGTNDGSIAIIPNGGYPPYNYSWNTGASDSLITNLSPNSYNVTVADSNGCEIIDTFVVDQAQLLSSYSSTNAGCNPTDNGTALVSIIEGMPPYTYLWNTGETTANLSGLPDGMYTVTITDSMNCISTENILIDKDTLILFAFQSDVTCYGYNNGQISTNITVGNPPYAYQWNTGATANSLFSLSQGAYSVTVTDSSGCTAQYNTTINEPEEIITSITTTPDDTSTGFGDGSATVNVYGGTPPYSVSWDDAFQQNTVTAINLQYGTYTVTVTDYNGCQVTDTANIYVLSAEELSLYSKIKMYPNLTRSFVNLEISLEKVSNIDISMYDLAGKLVLYDQLINVNKTIKRFDLSNYQEGLYCFSIIINDSRIKYYIEVIN